MNFGRDPASKTLCMITQRLWFTFTFVAWLATVRAETNVARGAPELVSVQKIWDQGKHNAFTDLIRFKGKWFCTFREAEAHVRGNGNIRMLSSSDGKRWKSVALLSEPGIDLRDPKLSVTPDNRLMLVLGGSVYEGRTLKERQSRVAFSKDGREWSPPQRVLEKGDWLWRVTWHQDRAYGVAYSSAKQEAVQDPDIAWTVKFVESKDGMNFSLVTMLDVPGRPNETTVRFLENNDCVALVRREAAGTADIAWIGISKAPYQDWKWQPAGMQIGGPNFLILDNNQMIATGRRYGAEKTNARTFVGRMDFGSVKPELILPSGGDCSYAGMVWHKGLLWLTYYSSHEIKTDIYLARVRLPGLK
jgi:hypothetical protein